RAPRTWGWTGRPQTADRHAGPSPTHVGMDRRRTPSWRPATPSPTHVGMDRGFSQHSGPCTPEPHARGDGPVGSDQLHVVTDRAPRTWGWTVPLLVADLVVGPSPTHVGMDRHPIRRHERSPHRAPRTWGWPGERSNTATTYHPSPTHVGRARHSGATLLPTQTE